MYTDRHINTMTRPGIGAGPSENIIRLEGYDLKESLFSWLKTMLFVYLHIKLFLLELGYNLASQAFSNDNLCCLELMFLHSSSDVCCVGGALCSLHSSIKSTFCAECAIENGVQFTRTLATRRVMWDLCGG